MILLDTNVLSALMRRSLEPVAVRWLDRQRRDLVWTTAITVFELRYGLELLPLGRRRSELEAAFRATIDEDLQGRVLPLDEEAAGIAAKLAARRRHAGRPVGVHDAQIAGIAASRGAILATRNTADFEGLDLDLVNPWESG